MKRVLLLILFIVAVIVVSHALAKPPSSPPPLTFLGLGLAIAMILGMRWVRSRLLALIMIVSIFGGVFASIVPVIRHRSWSVWLSSAAIILVVGTILILKLWNPLTGLSGKSPLRSRHDSSLSPTTRPIKVLSWNVFLRSVVSQRLGDNDFKEQRVRPIVDAFSDCDVVCLQEACSTANFRVHRLIKLARAKGFHYHVVPKSPPIFSRSLIDSGLLLLSKIPITAHDSVGLPVGIGDDAIMHKALQHAKVGGIDVYNTHVQSDYSMHPSSRLDKYEVFKRNQYSFIGKQVAKSDPAILCGDLNCNQHSCGKMIEMLGFEQGEAAGSTLKAVYSSDNGEEIQTVFYKKKRGTKGGKFKIVPRSVDFILQKGFHIPKVKVHEISVHEKPNLPVYLSDHQPVKAELTLKRSRAVKQSTRT